MEQEQKPPFKMTDTWMMIGTVEDGTEYALSDPHSPGEEIFQVFDEEHVNLLDRLVELMRPKMQANGMTSIEVRHYRQVSE